MAFTISVVIPAYNAEEFIEETLASVFAQTVPVDEVIVVDDGSTDGTAETITRHFPQVKLVQQANGGVSKARNTGIDNVSSDYLCFLDADDLWEPNKLELQIEALNTYQDSEFVLSDECMFDETGIYCPSVLKNVSFHKEISAGTAFFNKPISHLLIESFVSTSSVMISKSLATKTGHFSENLSIGEDREYWLKLALNSAPVFINLPLVKKRENHGSNISHISQVKWAKGLAGVISTFDTEQVRDRVNAEGLDANKVFAQNYRKFAEIFWNSHLYEESLNFFRKSRINGSKFDIRMLAMQVLPQKIISTLRS